MATDRDGNLKTNNYLSNCSGYIDGVEITGRRHRLDSYYIKFQPASGYVLYWIAILILSGGHFGSVKN